MVQRNAHASVVDGLVLSGGVPTYVAPEYDDELGMAHGVTPEALARGAGRAPRRARRVHRLADLLRHGRRRRGLRRGLRTPPASPLVVDQAWGPHFGFHPGVPASALQLGADAVLTSTHKIVGSLTQSAMLHVAPTRPDRPRRGRARGAARARDEPRRC